LFVKGVWVGLCSWRVPAEDRHPFRTLFLNDEDIEDVMVTFVSTLLIGAVAGWVFEQKHGSELLRWSRQKRMQMRALRRKGANPLDAWKPEQ
jgi:hypothetical protein